MSLRSALAAIRTLFERKKSRTPLREALDELARTTNLKASRQKFSEQRHTLTKLAQRMLTLASVAGAEDNKVIAGACTLLAGALTKQVAAKARASDDDWHWLARWPEKMLDCLAGGYSEAEVLVRDLLAFSRADSLSPFAVNVLLGRLKELSDAPDVPSPELASLYEQYCIRHQAGDQAVKQHDEEKVSAGIEIVEGIEKVDGIEIVGELKNVERVDAHQEDAAIAAEGAGLFADSLEVHDSVLDLSIAGFVPADDIAGHDNVSVMHELGDTVMNVITGADTSVSDTSVSDTTASDAKASEATGSDTTGSDTTGSDTTGSDTSVSTAAVQPDGEPPISTTKLVADEVDEDQPADQSLTGSSEETVESLATLGESTIESIVLTSNDDALTDDRLAGEGLTSNEMNESAPTMEALFPRQSYDGDSKQLTKSDVSCSRDVQSSGAPPSHTISSVSKSEFLDDVQLPLPGIAVLDNVAPGEAAVSDEAQSLPAPDLVETADATADNRSARDEATVDMFDELEVAVAGDESDVLYVATLTVPVRTETENADIVTNGPNANEDTAMAPGDDDQIDDGHFGFEGLGDDDSAGDPEAEAALRMLEEQSEAVPSPDDIFDAFDGTALGDDKDDNAVNLDEFVLAEESPTTIDDDVPAAPESADVEQPGLLANLKSAVFGSKDASKDATGAGVANDATGLAERSLQKAAPADRKLSRAAMQIVDVMLSELPELDVELGICAGVGESAIPDRKVVGEAVQRCAEVLKRFGSAADSVGFVGLARIVEIAREHVLSIAQTETLSDPQIGLLTEFTNVVRAYFEAPHAPDSAQSLLDWILNDGWAAPAIIDEPGVLLSLLANPDLSAIDEDASARQQRANPEDVSLAVPADANRDLLDGLLQELPVQSEEFSAAIERLMQGTGKHEDILVAQRIAHTIKGSGNTVGIRGLAALTHNIEDILLVLAQEKRLPSQPLADMLMNAADRLQAMTESLLGMGPPPEDALEVLQSVLDWANMIDRGGLPLDDATPDSLPELVRVPLVPSPSAPDPESPAVAVADASDVAERAVPVPVKQAGHRVDEIPGVADEHNVSEERKADSERKVDKEFEALLRVPARLVDQMLTTAGESIILTGQLRDRVRRSLADLQTMSSQFERQQQLGGELEKLIDVKDFSRRQAQHDIRFDALEMDQYNELHSAVRQLVESATDAREMGRALVDHLSSLDEMLISQEGLNRDTQDTVLHTRMVDVQSVFARLQRAARQTCRATKKKVELHLSGGETPMDSDALIRIVDPLMHLLRNAIDHGIEDAATRRRGGKTATGNVYLDFLRDGNDIVIICRDDGAGLNYDAIRHAAEERGLIGPDVSLDALKQIILRANFSTRSRATQISGRGIGLDAVHDGVLALGGTMTVESESGQGCSFEIRLPFNLISSHAVLVRAGRNVVALASRGVQQIVHGSDGEMRRYGDKTVFQVGDNVYPATSLDAVIGSKDERRENERHVRPVVLTRTDEGVTAVSVEAVIGSRDLVVKSLGKLLPKIRGVVGATILGDGQVAPVIDLPDMLSNRDVGVDVESAIATDTSTDGSGGFVLVVDDSLSARRALAQFMQDSGYRVRTARDGVEATQIVEGVRPVLVLADLEMPRMNGIELTAHLRSNALTAGVPVIMVTSRSTAKHREQAKSAGANAYLTKPYSEDMLIETVRGLIDEQEAKRRERPAA